MAENRTDKEESLRRGIGDYLQQVLGDKAYTAVREIWDANRKPPVSGGIFNLYETIVRGQSCVAVTPKEGIRVSPVKLKQQLAELQEFYSRPVFYASDDFRPHDAPRMMKLGIPFVCPHRHLYLPFLGAVLTVERKASLPTEMKFELGHYTQLFIIGYLLGRIPVGATIKDVAECLKCSQISIIKVFDELEMLRLGTRVTCAASRRVSFRFAYPRCELWRKTRPMMKSPCRQLVGVEELPTGCEAYWLFRNHTQKFEVYAIHEEDFRKATCQRSPLKGADIILQLWQYPPDLFKQDGHIDDLSRTLVLNDASEEEINRMLSEIDNSVE